MHTTSHPLPENVRSAMIDLLNANLANVIDFQLQAKVAHWNCKGPQFIALHKLFDEVYGIAVEAVDLIAERVAQLGGDAQGTLQTVAKSTTLPAYPVMSDGLEHVKALSSALAKLSAGCIAAIDQSTKADDMATADMFTEILRANDKYLWFLEAHIQK